MQATRTNFKDYWNLETVAGKPVSWYLQHPDLQQLVDSYYNGSESLNDSITSFFDRPLNDPKFQEILPFQIYFLFHVLSYDEAERNNDEDYIIDDDTAYFLCSDIMYDHTKLFCEFFLEDSPQKEIVLKNFIHFVSLHLATEDDWESVYKEHYAAVSKLARDFSEPEKQFLEKFLSKVKSACYDQI